VSLIGKSTISRKPRLMTKFDEITESAKSRRDVMLNSHVVTMIKSGAWIER
jgi:hypothetical protein